MEKGALAKAYFEKGSNCAQAVALAFCEEMGKTEQEIKKLLIGFGGGFGRQRLVCGAISGMTMVISYLKSDGVDKLACYDIIKKACAEFNAQAGSLICAELMGGVQGYQKHSCAELVALATEITQKYLKA